MLDGEHLLGARPHGQALHVAMPVGPDPPGAGVVGLGEGVVGQAVARGRIDPQHLPGLAGQVLRGLAHGGVTGADQQGAVGPEGQPAAAVPAAVAVDRDTGHQRVVDPGGRVQSGAMVQAMSWISRLPPSSTPWQV